jgi:hypothetical protein
MDKSSSKNKNNLFWHVKDGSKIDKVTLVEHSFKYGDFDDIVKVFKTLDKEEIKEIWLKTMAWDERFIKINLMIARLFFDMDVESDYFKGLNNGRFKVKLSVRKY